MDQNKGKIKRNMVRTFSHHCPCLPYSLIYFTVDIAFKYENHFIVMSTWIKRKEGD